MNFFKASTTRSAEWH